MKKKNKIVFITGTRADFGKLKSLMLEVDASEKFELSIFATGMHNLSLYGFTEIEIYRAGLSKSLTKGIPNIYSYINQIPGESMDLILANTINGLSRYVHEHKPDLLVVHGDRVEALAGAIVGALRNILVAHIEGGERSGTIDELIRHAVTKLSHIHFVANNEASDRLRQLGEDPQSIYIIGSPDIDIMFSPDLPDLETIKNRYDISFKEYYIVLFHSVTTELENLRENTENLVSALIESELNYVVIYPNNDIGCEEIFKSYKRLESNSRFRILPSMRFEYFLTLLKNAKSIIGNSSAGIREAPAFSVYSINIGTRQNHRYEYESIINVNNDKNSILEAITKVSDLPRPQPSTYFGDGKSAKYFIDALNTETLWQTPKQKVFWDLS